MANRRTFLQSALGFGAGLFAPSKLLAASGKAALAHAANVPVITTDVGDLPFTMDGDFKVFHLVAEVVKQAITPGKTLDLWGFNGSAPGPTIQVNQGDRVRVIFDNHLPEPTSMHWHGFEDLIRYDGQPGISQEPVAPGGRFVYEFEIHQAGTFFYHSHMGMQQMTGLLGGFIMHPREPYRPHCDKDFLLHLQEYAVLPSSTIPNTMNMEYNWLLLNGKAGPATTPLIVRQGDRVRIRFVNLGMDHHPMHMHGHTFHMTGTEGGRIPEAAWWPGNTVLVGVAQARAIEFDATNPGDWMIHCHLPHHMMNEMSSNVGRMTRPGAGMKPGMSMNAGMGMLDGTPGAPLGEDYGASLGRGMGFGSENDMATTNGPLSLPKAAESGMGSMGQMAQPDVAADANSVPNYPQDAFMEGPMMNVDASVERPENFGLRPGWSQYMQGMMTFVRVLPPEQYDAVMARMKAAGRTGDPYASMLGAVPASAASPAAKPAKPAAMKGMTMLLAFGVLGAALAHGQQAMPGMDMGPKPAQPMLPAAAPAPDLLAGVAGRTALSLQSFLDSAQRTSPALAQARDLAQRDQGEARQAAMYPNPTVGYQGEQIRGGSYGGGEQGGYIGQTIVLGGKLGLRREVFAQQQRADATLGEEQGLRVANDVTQAFYSALTAQAKVVLRQRLVGLAADAVETAHQLANVGQADEPDVLSTEIEAEQAGIDYVSAQREFLGAFRRLATEAGEPALAVAPLAGELEAPPQLDAEQQVETIVAQSPTLRRMEQQVAVEEARLRAARREAVPNLELRAGEQYNNEAVAPNRKVGPQSFASAGIDLPLWNRNQGSVDAASAELDRARQEVLRTQLALRGAAEPLAQGYLTARFAADRMKTEMIPRAQRAYALYQEKYRNMSEAYPQVLVSERALIELQMTYLNTLHEVWRNAVALQNFGVGGGSPTMAQTGAP